MRYFPLVATTCRSCGAMLPEGVPQCPSCRTLVKPQGFLQRLFGRFNVSLQVGISATPAVNAGSPVSFKKTVSQTYRIRDAATGEVKEYRSLEEVPAAYREKIRQAMEKGSVVTKSAISLTGPDGVARTYQSLDEVPADMRALIERAEKNAR